METQKKNRREKTSRLPQSPPDFPLFPCHKPLILEEEKSDSCTSGPHCWPPTAGLERFPNGAQRKDTLKATTGAAEREICASNRQDRGTIHTRPNSFPDYPLKAQNYKPPTRKREKHDRSQRSRNHDTPCHHKTQNPCPQWWKHRMDILSSHQL